MNATNNNILRLGTISIHERHQFIVQGLGTVYIHERQQFIVLGLGTVYIHERH